MNRTLFGLLALAIVAWAVWMLLDRPDHTERSLPADEEQRRTADEGPMLEGGAAERPDPGEASSTTAADASEPHENPETEGEARLTLEGRFLGWDRSLPGELSLRVARSDGEQAPQIWRVPSDLALKDGLEFSVDLSRLVAEGAGDLEVSVDHPAYVRHVARLHSGEAKDGRLFVEITLQRAAGIRGRVEDERGTPISGADVGVYSWQGGRPDRAAIEATKSRVDGTFLLRVGARGRYLVAAWISDRQAASTEIEVTPGTSVNIGTLVLREGLSIEGTVRYHGEPLAKAVIDLSCKEDEIRLSLGMGRLAWNGGRLHAYFLQVTSSDDGRYAFRGLTQAPYAIVVSGGDAFILHFNDVRDEDGGRRVRPPARKVDFDVAALRLVAEFQCDGLPLPDLSVWLNSLVVMEGLPEDHFAVFGYYPTLTDSEGRVVVHVSPGQRYRFGVSRDEYENFTDDFLAPKTGLRHHRIIEVKRKPERPKLKVRLVGPGANDIKRAGFGFYSLDGRPNPLETPRIIHDEECVNGQCLLQDLRPGRWVLHVRPGRDWHDGFSYYVESRKGIDLPRSGTTEIQVPVRLGGTLRITVKNAKGRLLGPDCKLIDAQGEDVSVDFTVRSEFGITISMGSLLEGAPNQVVQVLAPGAYELRFEEDGYRPKTVHVRLKAGQTTQLETILDPVR